MSGTITYYKDHPILKDDNVVLITSDPLFGFVLLNAQDQNY